MTEGDIDMLEWWRELGFYCKFDERLSENQWKFFGSKRGLSKLVMLLYKYALEKNNDYVGIDQHCGPYFSLTITTWHTPKINERGFMVL